MEKEKKDPVQKKPRQRTKKTKDDNKIKKSLKEIKSTSPFKIVKGDVQLTFE